MAVDCTLTLRALTVVTDESSEDHRITQAQQPVAGLVEERDTLRKKEAAEERHRKRPQIKARWMRGLTRL